MADEQDELKKALELLKRHGIAVHARGPAIKHSFVVDKALFKEFMRLRDALGWEVKECINDALEMWIAARKGQVNGKK